MTGLLVADSFLVSGGRVRGLALHRSRFVGSCASLGVSASSFFDDVVERLPRDGQWFPRLELWPDGLFDLRMRPAPPLGGALRVRVHDGPDPRSAPRVKGPDLDLLGALRNAAHDADEVLLTGPDDQVLEAAYASLLWWEGDTLCLPPQDLPLLPSVTVALLRRISVTRGVSVAERRRTVSDLDGCEAWLVNALHGIRPVRMWVGTAVSAGPAVRAASWQRDLEALAKPV
jgi:branched-subunit amino acid aminotransferase/4-amino-4-deoxychorismate lyase